ncbi:hypothetical protein [Halochromatium roseum]|uniref:hypothetical protein n=1 Tax=Halochromatium roseum TaxID=391920 RepID=UPI001911D702|nr:hypothetical protein [Halochromatium roseum]MBK5941979.1 hypothetical protein [Halochromatium roseum]
MFTKLLFTATVILVAWLVVRNRWRADDDERPRLGVESGAEPGARSPQRSAALGPLMPRGAVKLAAYGVVILMLVGTALYLFQDWQHAREIVQLQVVNVYSGQVEHYEAQRSDISQRSFVTLDGRRIQIAEMERLIQIER